MNDNVRRSIRIGALCMSSGVLAMTDTVKTVAESGPLDKGKLVYAVLIGVGVALSTLAAGLSEPPK